MPIGISDLGINGGAFFATIVREIVELLKSKFWNIESENIHRPFGKMIISFYFLVCFRAIFDSTDRIRDNVILSRK